MRQTGPCGQLPFLALTPPPPLGAHVTYFSIYRLCCTELGRERSEVFTERTVGGGGGGGMLSMQPKVLCWISWSNGLLD